MNTTVRNIWALDNDPTIKAILLLLQHEVGPDSFLLLDAAALNNKSVRLVPPAPGVSCPPTSIAMPSVRAVTAWTWSFPTSSRHAPTIRPYV